MDQSTMGNNSSAPVPPVPPSGGAQDSTFWKYQGNQFILLVIYSVVVSLASMFLGFIPVIGWLAIIALQIFGAVLFIIWIVRVVSKEMKPLPVIGNVFTFIK